MIAIVYPQHGRRFVTGIYYDALMDRERAERGEAYLHTFHDVLLDTGYWVVLDRDRAYTRETYSRNFANSPLVCGRVSRDRGAYVVSFPPPTLTIDAPCVLLGGDDNYSHWLSRSLLKLALLEGAADALPLLVNEDLRPHQREYIQLLGIPQARLLKVPRGQVIRCRELVVPTTLRNHPQMAARLQWIRSRLGRLLAAENEAGDLLYASRRDAARRKMLNEADLEEALADLGFRVIVAGQVSVSEQIAAFSRAKLIVAPHGAALTNLIFAPRSAAAIEIATPSITHMNDFRTIAGHLGQRMATLIVERYAEEQPADMHEMHWNYSVDVARVVDFVKHEALRGEKC
jgi:capsular polysaccharide biosynthesis protein